MLVVALTFFLAVAGLNANNQTATAGTMTNGSFVGWIGGSGGSNTSNPACAAGSVITTIKSYTYNNPNPGLGFICSSINADGTLGAQTTNYGSGTQIYACPAGTAAVGLFANGAPNDVGIICKTPPNQYDAAQRVGPTGTKSQNPTCPVGGFVNRLSVNTGAWFDGYQVGCTALSGYPSAVEAALNDAPTGAANVAATLTSASTFNGSPTPSVTYTWQRALSASGPWETISGATNSAYVPSFADAGYYIRDIAIGSNTVNAVPYSVTSTSPATAQITLATPATPVLQTASDTGSSTSDNITQDATPTLTLAGITAGADVTATATRTSPSLITQTCSLTAAQTSGGTTACTFGTLADGVWSVTTTQTSGSFTSTASAALSLTIDTTAPTISIVAPSTPNNSTTLTYTVNSTETLVGIAAADFSVTGTSCAIGTLTGSSSPYSLTVTGCATAANVVVTLAANSSTDAAGNGAPPSSLNTSASTVVTDRTAPTVTSWTAGQTSPTNATTLTYSLSFSESIVGLTTTDFTITGTSCVASLDTGSGTSFTLTLASCANTQTVSVLLKASMVADLAGNVGQAAATASLSVVIDRTAPTITSITTATTSPSKATSITYTFTPSEALQTLTTANFSVVGCSITSVAAATGNTYTIVVGNCTNGSTAILTANAGMLDVAGNALAANFSSTGTVIDYTAPTVTSWLTAMASPTNATSLTYTLTFSEAITGLAAADFTVTGTTCAVAAPTASGTTFTITVNSCGTATTATLFFNPSGITDVAGNAGVGGNTTTISLVVDRVAPTLTVTTNASTNTNVLPTFSFSFSEPIYNFTAADLTNSGNALNCTWNITDITASTVFSVTPSGCGQGTIIARIAALSVNDLANNTGPAAITNSTTITYDTIAPTVASITSNATSPSNLNSITYTVTLSEATTGITQSDFSVTGGAITAFSGTGASYSIIASTTTDGAIATLTLAANSGQDAAGNVGPATAYTTSDVLIDHVAPTLVSWTTSVSSPTNATSYDWIATFSEPVNSGVVWPASFSGTHTLAGCVQTMTHPTPTTYVVNFANCPTGDTATLVLLANQGRDLSGNGSTSANSATLTVVTDRTPATVTWGTNPTSPRNSAAAYTVTFNEDVTGLTAADISNAGTATGCTFAVTATSAKIYTITASNCSSGTLQPTIAASSTADPIGNLSPAADSKPAAAITIDVTAPSVTSMTPSTTYTNAASMTYAVVMSESVTGLTTSSFTAVNGTVASITGSGTTYTVTVNSLLPGAVTLQLNANAATDTSANTGPTTAYVSAATTVDRTAPTLVSWTTPIALTNQTSATWTATFSEPVSGLAWATSDFTWPGSVSCSTGTVTPASGYATTFTVTLSGCTTTAYWNIAMLPNAVQDQAANLGPAAQSAFQSVTWDLTPPTVTWGTAPTSPRNSDAVYPVTFSEAVTGFTAADITNNGTATGCVFTVASTSSTAYTVTTSGCSTGTVQPKIAIGAVTDLAGNTGPAAVSTATAVTMDVTAPTVTSITPSSTYTSAASITYAVILSKSVTGLTTSDFASSNGTVASVTGSGTTYTVTVNAMVEGATVLTLLANTVVDSVANAGPASAFNTVATTIDRSAAVITSIVGSPTYTSSTNAVWVVTFNEPVSGLAWPTDFNWTVPSGTGCTAYSTSPSSGFSTTYTVTLTGCSQGVINVWVLANTVTDQAGNLGPTASSAIATVTTDWVAPTLTSLSTTTASPSSATTITYTAVFSEAVTGLTASDFTSVGCSITSVAGSGTTYTVTVGNCTDGANTTLTLASSSVADLVGNAGPATSATTSAIALDYIAPTVTSFSTVLTNPTNATSLAYSIAFNKTVTGLTASDFTVTGTGCSLAITGSLANYTATLTGCADNQNLSIALAANSVSSLGGLTGPTVAPTSISRSIDRTAPTFSWGATPQTPTTGSPVFTLNFSENISGLTSADITNAGTAAGCSFTIAIIQASSIYTATAVGCLDGTVMPRLAAAGVSDAAGNTGPASATTSPAVTVDNVAPTATFTANPAAVTHGTLSYTLHFSEAINPSTLTNSDFVFAGSVSGCSIALTPVANTNDYTATVSGCSDGTIVLMLNASSVTDLAGNAGPATSAFAAGVTVDSAAPQVTSITTTTASPTNAAFAVYTITFNKSVTGLTGDATDFALTGSSCTFGAFSGSGTTYSLRINGCADTSTLTLAVKPNAVFDLSVAAGGTGNSGPIATTVNATTVFDRVPPTVTYSNPTVDNVTGTVTYTATFNKPVTGFTAADVTVTGVSATTPVVTAVSSTAYTISFHALASGSALLTVVDNSVIDTLGNVGPASVGISSSNTTSGAATIALASVSGGFTVSPASVVRTMTDYEIAFSRPITGLTASDFVVTGATGCVKTLTNLDPITYRVSLAGCADGSIVLTLPAGSAVDSDNQPVPAAIAPAVVLDTAPSTATITLATGPLMSSTHRFDVVFNETVNGLTLQDFTIPSGLTATGCMISGPTGSGNTYQISLVGCSPGTFAITMLANGVADQVGNIGPIANVASASATQPAPTLTATPLAGTTPTQLVAIAPTSIFGSVPVAAQNALVAASVVTPAANSPTIEIAADLTTLAPGDPITITDSQTVAVGDQIVIKVQTTLNGASTLDAVAFLNIGGVWNYLGRTPFTGTWINSSPISFADLGSYTLKIVLIDKATIVNMSVGRPIVVGKTPVKTFNSGWSLPMIAQRLVLPPVATKSSASKVTTSPMITFGRASIITDSMTNIGNQQVIINITTTAPAGGMPTLIQPAPPVAPPAPVVTSTPTPTPTPTATKTATPTPTPVKTVTPTPTVKPVVTPTPTAVVVAPTPTPTASPAAVTPTPTPSAVPTTVVAAAPQPTEPPAPVNVVAPIAIPTINPGEPVANPAIGATGDDNAAPVAFDPLASEAGVVAATETATQTVAVVSTVAAAAGAAAAAAAAGAAAGAAGAAAGAAGAGAASGASAGGSASGGSGGARSSSSSSGGSSSSNSNSDSGGGDLQTIDVEHDEYEVEGEHWGDRLAMFKLKFLTATDHPAQAITIALAKFSPVTSKIVNDSAYLRSIFGSLSLALPITGFIVGLIGIGQIQGQLLSPSWQLLLLVAVIGVFDAMAGAAATVTFAIGAVIVHGIPNVNELRLLLGLMLVGFAPSLLAIAFRKIRKQADMHIGYWWDRLVDLAVVTFLAGWTMSSVISTLPSLAALTMPAANHVNDFALAAAAAMLVRILVEEFASRFYPSRLNFINPTNVAPTSAAQKYIALAIRLGLFIFVSAALMGNSWQTWVGSFLFILPTLLGWYSDRLPNVPFLWKLLPSGIPGLALSLVIASTTTGLVGAWLGATPDLAQWSFVLLPIPLLLLSVLGLFGRHGENPDDERPLKTHKWRWVYRLGGIVMLFVTLRLAGIL